MTATATVAAAATQDKPKDREQSPQVYLPNSMPRGEQTVKVGDEIAVLPLVYTRAATIDRTIEVSAGGRRQVIAAGTVLPAEFLLDSQNGTDGVVAYCTPRKASERKVDKGMGAALFGGSLIRGIIRSATDAQFCLADRDHDGRAEVSMLVGNGWGPERAPKAIDPVPMTVANDVRVSANDDAVRIVFTGGGKSGPSFKFAVIQQGSSRGFTTFGGERAVSSVSGKHGWPQRASIASAVFVVTGYDPVARTVTIKWPDDVQADERIEVEDGLHYVVRYGYY